MRVENVRSLLPSFYFMSFFFFTSCIYSESGKGRRTHERKSLTFFFSKKILQSSLTRIGIGLQVHYSKSSEREREHTREITFPSLLPPTIITSLVHAYIQIYMNLISYRCEYKYRFDECLVTYYYYRLRPTDCLTNKKHILSFIHFTEPFPFLNMTGCGKKKEKKLSKKGGV